MEIESLDVWTKNGQIEISDDAELPDNYDYDITDYTDLSIQYNLFIAAHRIIINNGSNTKISYKKLLNML